MGTSNTIGFTTRYGKCAYVSSLWAAGAWAPAWMTIYLPFSTPQIQPTQEQCDPAYRAHSFFPGGTPVSLMDGSRRFVSAGITPTTWLRAFTPDDGEVLGSDWND